MGLSLPVISHHREGNDQLSWPAKYGDLLGVVFRWFATWITSQLQTCGPGLKAQGNDAPVAFFSVS